MTVPTRQGYDQWAAVYDTDGNPLIALEEPRVGELLGDVAGLDVADIGCGTGRHAIRLAATAAAPNRHTRVTAVDFSSGMLAQARAKPGAERVNWIEHDFASPLPLADRSFDRVLCALVFDHVKDIAGLVSELGRICRPDGWVVISVMHPAMMLKGVQARFKDPATNQEIRLASAPNQISDYITGILRAGLTIDHISEHAVGESLAARLPRAERYIGWPMLLLFRLRPARGR